VNVQVGTLPIGAATATTGLVLVDSTVGDGDVLNATVVGDWAAGSLVFGIETINLNMLVPGTTFSAAARTPGATTFGLTGIGAFDVTALSNSSTLSLGAGYTGGVTGALFSTAGAADVVNVTLAGSVATTAAVGASVTLAAGGIETANINVTAASSLRVAGSGILSTGAPGAGTVAATNLTGTAALTLFGAAADLGTAQLTTSALYTGALTVRPSTNAAMDFAAVAGGQVTGIRTIDLSDTPAFNSAITLAATNGAFAPTVSFAPVTAGTSVAAIEVLQSGTALTDALAVSLSANAAGVTGAITAVGTETLTISGARAGTVAIANVVLTDGLGTQSVTVTGGATTNFTLGNVTADTVNTAGVTGTVSLTLVNTAGVVFTGGAGATTVVGTAAADIISTGIGADFITGGVGNDIMTGGSGVDTFIFNGVAGTTNNVTAGAFDQINDFTAGVDKLQFAGVVDVVSGQQAAVQTAVTALAAGSTALQIANAMALANTTNLGVSFATFGGDTYVLYETAGGTGTFTVADDIFIKLVGVTTVPTFAADVTP
jgi:Ca2+-binding RTX toxin-like protein